MNDLMLKICYGEHTEGNCYQIAGEKLIPVATVEFSHTSRTLRWSNHAGVSDSVTLEKIDRAYVTNSTGKTVAVY